VGRVADITSSFILTR